MSYDEDEIDFEDEGPQPGDLVTEDHIHFYEVEGRGELTLQKKYKSRYWQFGDPWDTKDAEPGDLSDKEMWKQIDEYMDKQKFYPNVWWRSDHGNDHLMNRSKRSRKRR